MTGELATFLKRQELRLRELRPAGIGVADPVLCFTQGNVAISRKKLQPSMKAFFAERGG